MDRDVTNKILYGPKQRQKNEFGQNPEENIILTGPGQYTKLSFSYIIWKYWLAENGSHDVL
jgi:hypothetical protein